MEPTEDYSDTSSEDYPGGIHPLATTPQQNRICDKFTRKLRVPALMFNCVIERLLLQIELNGEVAPDDVIVAIEVSRVLNHWKKEVIRYIHSIYQNKCKLTISKSHGHPFI